MHKIILCMVIFLTILKCVQNDIIIDDDDDQKLPPVYYADPYDNCIKNKNLVCRISIKLNPANATHPSKSWKLIEETKRSSVHYSRDELSHLICVDRNFKNDVKEYSNRLYTEKYAVKGLTVTVTDVDCNSDNKYTLKFYDFAILAIIFSYVIFGLLSSLFDKNYFKNDTINQCIECFSITRNFSKILESYHNSSKGDKLMRLQSIRFYINLWIVIGHSLLICLYLGVVNIELVEKSIENVFVVNGVLFLVHSIQIYFLLSGWFLSYRTYAILNKKNITLGRYMCLALLNRFMRLLPHVLILTLIFKSRWFYSLFSAGLPAASLLDTWYQNCEKNWWTLPLFISNHYDQKHMCLLHLWYISADTQIFIISLICLIMGIRLKRPCFFFVIPLVAGISITSVIFYNNGINMFFALTPDYLRTFFSRPNPDDFCISYTSTYSNLPTYSLGVIFGYIYYHLGNKNLFTTKSMVVLWHFSIFVLPIAAVFIIDHSSDNEIFRAVLGAICKPLFGLGIGVGILGLLTGVENFIAKFFDWKMAIFLGNFTYSTYTTHVIVLGLRHLSITEPRVLTYSTMALTCLKDVVLSFALGFVFYLLTEMPLTQLHNILFSKYVTIKVQNKDSKMEKKNC